MKSPIVALVLIAIIVCSLVLAANTYFGNAQSSIVPKPSVPEFSLKLNEHSQDIAPSSTIDPYTGENKTIPAAHYEWKTLQIIIKNQPAPYELKYIINMKGHYSQNWTGLARVPQPKYGEYTTITYVLNGTNNPPWLASSDELSLPEGSVDFQVQAQMGYEYRDPQTSWYTSTSSESDWSTTQTITIPEASPSPTTLPTPTATPTLAPASTPAVVPTSSPAQTIALTQTPTLPPSNQPSNQGVSEAEFYTTIAIFAAIIVALAIAVALLAVKVKKTSQTGSRQ